MFTATILIDSDDEIEVPNNEKHKSKDCDIMLPPERSAPIISSPDVVDLTEEYVDPMNFSVLKVLEEYMNVSKTVNIDKPTETSCIETMCTANNYDTNYTSSRIDLRANVQDNFNENNLEDVIDLTEDSLKKATEPLELALPDVNVLVEPMDIDLTNEVSSSTSDESNSKHTTNAAEETFAFLLDSWLSEVMSHHETVETAINNKAMDTSSSANHLSFHSQAKSVNDLVHYNEDVIDLTEEPVKVSSMPLADVVDSTEEAMDIVDDNNNDTASSLFFSSKIDSHRQTDRNVTIEENALEASLPSRSAENDLQNGVIIVENFADDVIDLSEEHLDPEPSVSIPSIPCLTVEAVDKNVVANQSTSNSKNEKSDTTSVETITETVKKDLLLKHLTRRYNKVKQKITDLEEAEVDLNDDFNSNFIIINEYKAKAYRIAKKMAVLTGQNMTMDKETVKFEQTQFPEFNRKLEKMVNNEKISPDFLQVLKCLKLCDKKYKYQLTKQKRLKIAQEAIVRVGRASQKRRKLDLDEMLSYYSKYQTSPDPALDDAALDAKLNANKRYRETLSTGN